MLCRKVAGALKVVHEKYQKTQQHAEFLKVFDDAKYRNETIHSHIGKVSPVLLEYCSP